MNPVRSSLIKKLFISNKESPMTGKASNEVKINSIYSLVVIALVNIGFYYGLILPQKTKADNLFKEIGTMRSDAVVSKSPASFSKIKGDIVKFKNMLPQKAVMTKIIRELDTLAKDSSLSIHDISYESKKLIPASFKQGAEQDNIFPLSFSFPIEGKYSNIKNFIYQLESSGRLITIDDLNLEKASGKEDIRLKIRATIYLKNGSL